MAALTAVRAGPQRLLPADGAVPVDLRAHLARYGALARAGDPRRVIGEEKAAGLTGRGGGGAFPVWRKLAAAADCRPTPLVAGNGAEGEPASSKDRTLLWAAPHLVLDGLQVAAAASGSRSAVLYVQRNPRLRQRLAQAIAERAVMGMDTARVELREAPDRFVAGEESALASRLTGRPARPAYRPARELPRMGSGQPILVQNVESLAHLALIARYGAAWFRAAGTADEPGTMLATLRVPDGRVRVAEVPLGTPLASLLGLTGGVAGDEVVSSAAGPVRAVLVGGYHGTWLPAAQAARLPLANAALRPLGAAVGAGVVAALPADRCCLAESARVARYLALESAGQCGPCLNGAEMTKRLRVDPTACAGHGLCAELAPELVTLDEWGYPIVTDRPVPRALDRTARRAVADCPALALALTRVP